MNPSCRWLALCVVVAGGACTPRSNPSAHDAGVTGASGSSASAAASGTSTGTSQATSVQPSGSGASSAAASCGRNEAECTPPNGGYGHCCDGVCRDYYDPDHCQVCGNACVGDEYCVPGGGCLPPYCDGTREYCGDRDAGMWATCCGTECARLTGNPRHCGSCSNVCADGQTCQEDVCLWQSCVNAPTGGACAVSATQWGQCCNGVCTNVYDDSAHCGVCGRACPAGAACSSGIHCYSGGTAGLCTGGGCPAGSGCVTAGNFCAATSCAGLPEGFACQPGADTQGLCCGGACLATDFDDANCGACGHACTPSEWCSHGNCTPRVNCATANGPVACPVAPGVPGTCCNGACINPRLDAVNCGGCGLRCPGAAACDRGQCTVADGGHAACQGDAGACPPGEVCQQARCLARACAGAWNGGRCAFGLSVGGLGGTGTCCGGACVDVQQDPQHCMECGFACASQACLGSFGGGCFPATSPGASCPYDCSLGGMICVDGSCVRPACDSPMSAPCAFQGGGLGICCMSGMFSNACMDWKNDPDNCGGCGARCAPGQTCVDGLCTGGSAACGRGDLGRFCDADGGTRSVCCASGCADLQADEANCGWCNQHCAAGTTCVAGSCATLSCAGTPDNAACYADGGFGFCCSAACVDRQTDPNHCGECGHRCAGGAVCRGGRCGVDVCDAPHAGAPCFADGGGAGRCCAAGCVDTTSDHEHCGGCGLPCGPTETCLNSGCH
ncbi:MAG: hypothetical protein HY904_14455 [Deltaproteobacteria bacterium]|nr:hypothetical protein [Deltaproteobacteria bacterium]